MTAHAMKEDRERCLRVGCDEYATKPVNVPALLQLMARVSGRMATTSVAQQMLDNPVLRQLTKKFCDGIQPAMVALRESAAKGAWEELAVGAHRLAGAGGAYGFDTITREAKAVERAAQRVATRSLMKNRFWYGSALAFGLALFPTWSQAHFKLLAPASWLVENQLGDPQKAAPCGGTNTDFGKPTYYALISLIIGPILLLILACFRSDPGPNRYGRHTNSPAQP